MVISPDENPLVLVCDDDSVQRLLIRECLESAGMVVVEAESGREAIELVTNHRPDFIFMDIEMPGLNGIEVCRILRDRPESEDTPILIVTGADDRETIDLGFEAGATQYITKPLNWPLLGRLVKYMLRTADAYLTLKQNEDHLRYLAYFDHLTDLPNRRNFNEQLRRNLADRERNGGEVGLIMIDIDHFKRINDSLGHERGDLVLQRISARLKTCLNEVSHIHSREIDADIEPSRLGLDIEIARLGGDEFSVLVKNPRGKKRLTEIADHLIDCVSKPIQIPGHTLVITPSMGIAIAPDHGVVPEDLLIRADTAAYAAKAEGRNRSRMYDSFIADVSAQELAIEAGLRDSLSNTGLSLVYQPQVDLSSGRITGAEALLRWEDSKGTSVAPDRFIPVAERSGLINDLGDWVLRQIDAEISVFANQLPAEFSLAVNLSPLQFSQSNFIDRLTSAVKKTDLKHKLVLEITENTIVNSVGDSIEKLHHLRSLGFEIAIDDFGTGYSSLNYLKNLPVDTLKIDRTFVNDIGSESGNAIINAIISMAQALNLNLVAEGIETISQVNHLRELKCNSAQGYLISKPLRIVDFVALCEQSHSLTFDSNLEA